MTMAPRVSCSASVPPAGAAGARGIALLTAMLLTMMLTAVAAAVIVLTMTETALTRSHRLGLQTLYAADAGIEWAVQELRGMPNWTPVLTGAVRSRFTAGSTSPRMADGMTVDLRELTTALQREADRDRPVNPDAVRWQLFGHGWLGALLQVSVPAPLYWAVWVGDDPGEQDGDPTMDSNGRVRIRSEAFGPFRSRRVIEAVVVWRPVPPARPGAEPGGFAQLSGWRLLR